VHTTCDSIRSISPRVGCECEYLVVDSLGAFMPEQCLVVLGDLYGCVCYLLQSWWQVVQDVVAARVAFGTE
jgi:hypothetical protein